MNLIELAYPETVTNELDKLNAQMEFIVNRASAFKREKYIGIVIPFLRDDLKSFMLYQAVRLVSLARHIPFSIDKKSKKLPWIDQKNVFCSFISNSKIEKMLKAKSVFRYDSSLEDDPKTLNLYPRIFAGFDQEMIAEIAKGLYNYGVKN